MEATIEPTELDESKLIASVQRLLNEAAAEFDGQWRQVAGGQQGTVSGGNRPLLNSWSSLHDRDEGRYLPFYEHEHELRSIRAKARNLATFTSIAVGAVEALTVYTIGGQWQYEAVSRERADGQVARQEVLSIAQRVIDEALERNDFQGTLDDAIHRTAREDGESLVAAYHAGGGQVDLELLDADCLREPQNHQGLNRALAAAGFANLNQPSSWTFGVHNVFSPVKRRIDYARPAGYHCVFDESGRNWDYLPAFPQQHGGRLGGKCLVHLKLNVPPSAKRGITDFYPIQEPLERKYILGRNLSIGAAVQAAIAYIREHQGTATREGVMSQLSSALDNVSRAVSAGRVDGKSQQNLPPGSVIDVSQSKYHAGPLGELRSPIFIEVCSYLMRCCGIRWLMPEYMISGDASNANFASTLVAESPFVRARERDQRQFSSYFRRILWAALKIAFDAGRFGAYASTWQELRSVVDLRIKAPPVASRDKTQVLAESMQLYKERLISANDLLTDLQREPRPEWDDKFADPPQPAPMLGGLATNPTTQAALAAALESVRTTDEAKAILESVRDDAGPQA